MKQENDKVTKTEIGLTIGIIAIPIYRAKKIDSNMHVIGYLNPPFSKGSHSITIANEFFSSTHHQINPSTLQISFDSGERWRSIKEVANILKDIPICKVCNDTGTNHGAQRGHKYYSIPCTFCNKHKEKKQKKGIINEVF